MEAEVKAKGELSKDLENARVYLKASEKLKQNLEMELVGAKEDLK